MTHRHCMIIFNATKVDYISLDVTMKLYRKTKTDDLHIEQTKQDTAVFFLYYSSKDTEFRWMVLNSIKLYGLQKDIVKHLETEIL